MVVVEPVDVASERPPGSVPVATVHANVPVAVVEAVRPSEYALPTVPLGAEVGEMESEGAVLTVTVIELGVQSVC